MRPILCFYFMFFSLPIVIFAQAQLPPWQEGFLDIHHISTGRGNAAYIIMPDGTTMLIDAGDISDTHPRTLSPRNATRKPHASRSTGYWVADYIRQFAPSERPQVLDYALITHYHDDHFGEWDSTRPLAANGEYHLTGIMEVGDLIPIKTLIDRGFDFPIDLKSLDFQERALQDEYHIVQTLQAYWKFIDYHKQYHHLKNEMLQVGSKKQIQLQHKPSIFKDFEVRNLAVNGRIWTGFKDNDFYELYKEGQYPGENPLSTCIKITYGKFDYFTGGDISGVNGWGEADFNSVEAHLAPVVGAVDVATLNHHGNRDALSAYFVRTLRPRVWVQQLWSSDHPGEEVLRRITSDRIYPGKRDLFTTDMLEANELVIGERIANTYKSRHGHVVVRVYEQGAMYKVFILNDQSEKREVMMEFGPYESR